MERKSEVFVVYTHGGEERFNAYVEIPSYLIISVMSQSVRIAVYNELMKVDNYTKQIVHMHLNRP